MSLSDLLTAVSDLTRVEKLQLIQSIAAELAREDDPLSLIAGKSYPVWSPYESHNAAAVLLEVLEADQVEP